MKARWTLLQSEQGLPIFYIFISSHSQPGNKPQMKKKCTAYLFLHSECIGLWGNKTILFYLVFSLVLVWQSSRGEEGTKGSLCWKKKLGKNTCYNWLKRCGEYWERSHTTRDLHIHIYFHFIGIYSSLPEHQFSVPTYTRVL